MRSVESKQLDRLKQLPVAMWRHQVTETDVVFNFLARILVKLVTGYEEREFGNECTAVNRLIIQNDEKGKEEGTI